MAVGFLDDEFVVDENDVSDAEAGFFPLDFATCRFDAAKLGDALVLAAVDAVEVAIVLDRRGVLARKRVVVGPDGLHRLIGQRSEGGADAVAGGEEHVVADDERRRGVDGGSTLAEGKKFSDAAAGRVGDDAVQPGDEDGFVLAADAGGSGRRIARRFSSPACQGRRWPDRGRRCRHRRGRRRSRGAGRPRGSACCRREYSFVAVVVGVQGSGPELVATPDTSTAEISTSELDGVQVARRAEDEDGAAGDERDAARGPVGIDAAAIRGGKIGFPERLAASSGQAFDWTCKRKRFRHCYWTLSCNIR